MSNSKIVEKLNAKIKLLTGNSPSVIDEKYMLKDGGFDALTYDSDKALYFKDLNALELAISHFEKEIIIERALSII